MICPPVNINTHNVICSGAHAAFVPEGFGDFAVQSESFSCSVDKPLACGADAQLLENKTVGMYLWDCL